MFTSCKSNAYDMTWRHMALPTWGTHEDANKGAKPVNIT